ncbi:MAG: hypothetical protein JWN76_2361 [Chitinophagaceae bacterium]|nr:hypothetical protein [Chitinophagaceae bacterium]
MLQIHEGLIFGMLMHNKLNYQSGAAVTHLRWWVTVALIMCAGFYAFPSKQIDGVMLTFKFPAQKLDGELFYINDTLFMYQLDDYLIYGTPSISIKEIDGKIVSQERLFFLS